MTEIIAGINILFGFIVFPILIFVFFIFIGSTVNLLPSYLIARYISNFSSHYSRLIFMIFFTLCAVVLHLNFRIPGVIKDTFLKPKENVNISEVINAYIGDKISIEINDDNIQYKPKYFESTWLSANHYFYGFENAELVTDNFISRLKHKGLKIEYNTDAPLKIRGSIQKSSTHNEIKINVMKNNKILAEYSNRFRTAFPGEQSDNRFLNIFFTIQQSTPTRLIFPDFWQGMLKNRQPQVKYPVSKFLADVLHISPQIETLEPVKLKISSSKTQIQESMGSDEKNINGNNEFCQFGNTKVYIAERQIINEENLASRKMAGYWLKISKNNMPDTLTYLQAPQGQIYRRASIRKTVCTNEHIYVLVSFAGVGKSEEEWDPSFDKRYGQISTNNEEGYKFMSHDMFMLELVKQDMVQKELRKAWILKYSYDGSLEEAAVFTLPYDFPQHIEKLSQVGFGGWFFSGQEEEIKRVGANWRHVVLKKYDVLLEKDEQNLD